MFETNLRKAFDHRGIIDARDGRDPLHSQEAVAKDISDNSWRPNAFANSREIDIAIRRVVIEDYRADYCSLTLDNKPYHRIGECAFQ